MLLIPAGIHVGVTGLTAPGGSETPEKPVGTMFVYGMRAGEPLFSERVMFSGLPETIILQTIAYTARRIREAPGTDLPVYVSCQGLELFKNNRPGLP